MAIRDKYRFESDIGTLSPTNSEIVFEWRKEGEDGFFVKHLESDLRLQNISKESIFDFDRVYSRVRSGQICEPININVTKMCPQGSTDFFNGYLSIIDGTYDIARCVADIKPRSTHGLSCVVDNWEREHNFYQQSDEVSVRRLEGVIKSITCTETYKKELPTVISDGEGGIFWRYAVDCLPERDNLVELYPKGWTPYRAEMKWTEKKSILISDIRGTLELTTTYIREEWTGSGVPQSEGWIYDDSEGVYYRPVPTLLDDETESLEAAIIGNGQLFAFRQWRFLDSISNGRRLNDVLESLFRFGCGYEIKSNFFGINPDGTEPDNIAYTFARDYLWELVLLQKLDVLIHDSTEEGTNYPISLRQLWRNLRVMFNVELRLEDENYIRIEHVSYYQDRFMLDLTKEHMQRFILHKGQFEYKKEELPRFERWEWMDRLGNPFFDQGEVEYEGVCVDDEENKEISYIADMITTDIDGAIAAEAVNEEGFFLVATKDGTIIREAPEGFEHAYVNGVLGWRVLLPTLHIWKRKKTHGIMNEENRRFVGRPKNRVQKDIQVPICCSEIDNFQPEDLVKTQFGWGAVESASWNAKTEILTLTLLHD